MTARDAIVAGLTALAVMAANVAASVLWVFVYSLVEPGHPDAFYEAYARRAAPVSSVIVGAPLMFGAAWLLARSRTGRRAIATGVAVAAVYVALDLAIMLAVGGFASVWGWALASWGSKLLAAWLGARAGRRA